MSDQIRFKVGFDVDQSSIQSLKTALNNLMGMTKSDFMKINSSGITQAGKQLEDVRKVATAVQDALKKAFNQKLGTINVQTFNSELAKSNISLNQIHQTFKTAGVQGEIAFRSLANQVTSVNSQLKLSHSILDKIGETLGNTIKWNLASGAINKITGNVQEAYGYVKALDGSLNDIRIVTGKSKDEMADFAKEANNAAKALGASTVNYTKSALTFYQQGLNDEDVKARADISNKVSNVTGLSGDQSAEYVTAVLNGYKVGSEEAEQAMDKLAAVAASTASDLAELSEGMSKVASAANAMGVSEDQLAATLATVISVTRQSASTVGTAFKTIYARMADIEAGVADADISLGEYSSRMADLGFNVLDSEGKLRDLGMVMEEIGGSWRELSREQQVSLARAMAGTRQYNNLIALFDNWDEYTKSLNVSLEANGTLQQQQDIYMQSTAAHLKQLSASMEDVYDSLLDTDAINTLADIFAALANGTADWIDSIGGGAGVLETLGSVAVMVFSKQIAKGINTTIENFMVAKNNAEQLRQAMDTVQQFKGIEGLDKASQQMLGMKDSMYQLSHAMSPESFNAVQNSITGFVDAANQVDIYTNKLELLHNAIQDFDSDNLSEHATEIVANFEDSVHQLEQLHTQAKNVRKALQNVKLGSSNTLGEDLNTATSSMESLIQAAKRMHDTGELTGSTWDRMKGAIKEYNSAIEEAQQKGQDLSNNNGAQRAAENLIAVFNGRLNASIKSTKELMDQLMKEGELTEDSLSNMLHQAQEEAEKTGTSVQTILQNATRQEIISNFTKMAGAISSVGFAIQNIQNLGDIWNNEDLTTGEKILQTATNLATTLPMLLSGYTALKSGIIGVTSAKKVYSAATTAMAATETAGTVATAKATTAQLSFNAAILANPLTWALVAIIGAAAAAYGLYTGSVQAAAEAEQERLATSIDSATALEDEADSINDVYIAYKNLYDTFIKTGEGEDELRDTVLSLADAFGIQIDTLDILAGRYDEINKKILETRANQAKVALDTAKEGKTNAEKQLAIHGTDENSKDNSRRDIIFNTGAKYDSDDAITNAILNKHVTGLNMTGEGDRGFQWESTVAILGIAEDSIIDTYQRLQAAYSEMTNNLDASVLDNSELYVSIGKWLTDNEQYFSSYESLEKDLIARAQEFAEIQGALTAQGMDIAEVDSYADYTKYKEQYIEQLRNALGGDENIVYDENLFDSTDEYLEYLTTQYLGAIDKIKDYVETSDIASAIKKAMFGNSSANEVDVNNFIDSLSGDELKLIATIGIDEGATEKEVRKTLELARKQAEDSLGQATADAINTVMASYNSTKNPNKSQQEELDAAKATLNTYLSTTEGIYGMTTAMEEWEMVSQRGTLAQLEYLQDLAARQNEYANHTEENLREELSLEFELLQAKKARLDEEAMSMDALGNKVLAYENLKKESDFNAASDEAKAIFDTTEAYETAARKVNDYREEVTKVAKSIQDIRDTLEDGDLAFEVDMSNVEEILSVGDTILSEAEKIKEAAELIGEGFIVAADDADKLAEIFPQLLESATVTSDGIIHLDQQTVEALLGGQQEILDGDVSTAIAKIDNQIAILQARKEAAETELELANAVARGEVGIEEARTKILADGQQQLTNYLMKLGMEESQAQAAATAAMAENLDQYNQLTAGVADDVANNLAGAMNAAANATQNNASGMIASLGSVINAAHQTTLAMVGIGRGQIAGSISGGAAGGGTGGANFGASTSTGSFSGSSASSASASGIDISGWQDQLLGDIAGYDQAIADLTALKAKLLANQKNASSALGGAMGGSGGKPSHGGGGSSNKDKKADQLDLLKDELDVYHDIDIQIQNIERDIAKLEKQEEFLTGQDLIDNLTKQLELLQKQKEAYADKIELAKMESNALKSALETYGATFDEQTGEITNYYDLLNHQLEKTNSIIAAYNNLSSEAQTDEEKQKVESAKAAYEQLKNLIANYEKTIFDVIPGLQEQIEDSLSREIEIQIQEFDMKLQLRLDMSAAQRDWNEFKRKVIDGISDDDLTGFANQRYKDWLSYYNTDGKGNGSIQAQTDRVNQILQDLNNMKNGGHSSVYSAYDANTGTWIDDIARAEEDLKKASESLMQDLSDIVDLENNMKESFLDSIDAVQNAFDKQKAGFDFIGEQIEHDIKMMELLYGDKATKKLDGYYQNQIKNTKAEMQAQMQAKAYWKDKMDAERAAIEAGEGSKEAFEKYEENWKASVSNVNSLLENWIDQVTAKYENTISNIIDSLNDKLSNGSGLDYLNEELSLLNDNAGNYLDTINASYAIQDLSNKWQNAINNTDNIENQEQLNNLMQQQLDMLESKGKLTQYDIDRAEKEYEIALKQIALQEAQHNKSKMRLRRDSNGNYSYQFVSDEENIRKAEEELAAAKNELYNFDKSAYQNNLNDMYSVWNEFQQKVAEAYQKYAGDQDALNEHIALLQKEYGEKINYLTEQNLNIRNNLTSSAIEGLSDIYGIDVENFQAMTDAEKNLILNDLIPQWDSGVQQMIDKFAGEGGFEQVCQDVFDQLGQAARDYQDELDNIRDKNEQASQEVHDQSEQILADNNKLLDAAKAELERINDILQKVQELQRAYKDAKEEAIAATAAAYQYAQVASIIVPTKEELEQKTKDELQRQRDEAEAAARAEIESQIKNSQSGNKDNDNFGGSATDPSARRPGETLTEWRDRIQAQKTARFATGGYTSSWGNEGRLAILDQKELVLNADDTKNMLSAISLLRHLVNEIGTNALDNVRSKLSGLNITNVNTNSPESFEQKVYIEAKFEGQTEASQIETALNNLVNTATQRMYHNRK